MAAQLPDSVLLNGLRQQLYSNPLEDYWIRLDRKRPAFYPSPNCKRGYVATWEIRDNQFFLKEVDGEYERNAFFFRKRSARYSIKTLFPKAGNRLVKASWYSGRLRVPQGKMTLYDEDYRSRFEQEIIITIEKGVIKRMVILDNTKRMLTVNPQV